MAQERISIIPAVFLFLKDNDRLLMSRRYNTGYCDGFYSFIAGHVEENETFREAMVRETNEEAGIIVKSNELKVVHVTHRYVPDEKNRIDIFMTVDTWQGEVRNMECHKCDHIGWFSENDLPNNTIPYIKHAILQINSGVFYSEFGFEDHIGQ